MEPRDLPRYLRNAQCFSDDRGELARLREFIGNDLESEPPAVPRAAGAERADPSDVSAIEGAP